MHQLDYFIPHRFPSLNTVIEKARRHWAESSKQKKELTRLSELYTRRAMMEQGWEDAGGPVTLEFTWYEPNRKRDQDNITSAQKFVIDGMVSAGLIPNDTQRWIPQPSINHIRHVKDGGGVEIQVRRIESGHGKA